MALKPGLQEKTVMALTSTPKPLLTLQFWVVSNVLNPLHLLAIRQNNLVILVEKTGLTQGSEIEGDISAA
jgi:hypothetical protein